MLMPNTINAKIIYIYYLIIECLLFIASIYKLSMNYKIIYYIYVLPRIHSD